jgi:L-ribulose-5-phosphate 4-epimerase
VKEDYEGHTGKVIAERFAMLDPLEMPAVLVAGHGPFSWGKTPAESVKHSLMLEKSAKMAMGTLHLTPGKKGIPEYLLEKHYMRKHGPDAYYGQGNKGEKE